MGKKARANQSERKAEKKLEKARLRLSVAQDRYIQVRERGKQGIEKARLDAQEQLDLAGEEVEKRVAALTRAESNLQSIRPQTPESATAVLEGALEIVEATVDQGPDTILVAVSASNGYLSDRESRALRALQEIGDDRGVSSGQWREVAGMSNTTLSRARDRLVEFGYVTRGGDTARDTRYFLTERGKSL